MVASRKRCRALAITACVLSVWIFTPAVADEQRPNVLFLICDDLNCDLGAYGHPLVHTPNIDQLAARGRLFRQAHCQYPLCGPSRASFLTGLYPDQTLIHGNGIYIRERIPNVLTLPQTFRSAGYFATRIGKLYHYNVPKHIGTSGHDDPYSWNYTINPRGRDKDDEDLIFSLKPGSFGATLSWLAAEGRDEEQTDGIAANEAITQLESYADGEQSFFLAVGFYRPHTPYVAPAKYFELYPLSDIQVPNVPEGYLKTLPELAAKSVSRKKEQVELSPLIAQQAIQAYYASISFVDAQVGRILDSLDRLGLAEETIIVFTSDHGYHMGEHGHWQKTTLFENATRVPLIMAGPGVPAGGGSIDVPVEMVDIYPTLTELCGVKSPSHLAGLSLTALFNDPSEFDRPHALTQYGAGYSLRTQRYRLTIWGESGGLGRELYDHLDDPHELKNLAGSPEVAEVEKRLFNLLEERIQDAIKKPKGIKQIRTFVDRSVPQPNN